MRYAPSSRLAYTDQVAVPALVKDFGEKLALIRTHATERAAALKMASARKGLANEYKRSLGKKVMMRPLSPHAHPLCRSYLTLALSALSPVSGPAIYGR